MARRGRKKEGILEDKLMESTIAELELYLGRGEEEEVEVE